MIIIKRYDNRKLYNTQTSQYVTLKQVHEYVKNGEVVRVFDKGLNRDVTTEVLVRALMSVENLGESLTAEALTSVIRSGNLAGAINKTITGGELR